MLFVIELKSANGLPKNYWVWTVQYLEIAKSEILDWWDEARGRVAQSCAEAERDLSAFVDSQTENLTTVDLLNPWSDACHDLQSEIERKITEHQESLAKQLEMSLRTSIEDVENSERYREVDWSSAGLLAASGASAMGALGLAVGATGLATTTLPAFVFFATTSFSWPLFALIGTGAIALGAVSVTARSAGHDWARHRYRAMLKETIHEKLVGGRQDERQKSCQAQLCKQLDDVRDTRMEALTQ